ncbi:MAG: manganese efflux pump MntP family protein [Oscillospiraceae bacterium]
MNTADLILLSLGLSADAFAVSVTDGMSDRHMNFAKLVFISLVFGIFQGVMPALGYAVSCSFLSFITDYGSITAFILLCGIGIKMIAETIQNMKSHDDKHNSISAGAVMVQGLATSIDALAVGISFSAVGINIAFSCTLIMAVTFICCMLGVFIGMKFGDILSEKAQLAGGAVLIAIGIKTLVF